MPALLVPLLLTAALCLVPETAWTTPTIQLEPLVEWNGPHFRVVREPSLQQRTDEPVIESPFILPRAAAARQHDGRDVVYVLDAGNQRVQAFEVNVVGTELSQASFRWVEPPGSPGPAEFTSDRILLPEWAALADRWVLPGSELLYIDGAPWERVEVLSGFTTVDKVYALDYGSAAEHPQILLAAGSLTEESTFELRYLISDYRDGGSNPPSYGLGDVDYGIHRGSGSVRRTTINESSGGPSSWQQMRSLALLPDPQDPDRDLLFLLDSADNSSAQDEEIFSFRITEDGLVTPGERYNDRLERPYDVAVSEMDSGRGAWAQVAGVSGPFDPEAGPYVTDANQVTGHQYLVTVHPDTSVSIQDQATGRLLVSAAPAWTVADPFRGIPGLALPLNQDSWYPGETIVSTNRAYPGRYLFVADEGADRIKIIGLGGGISAQGSDWSGDWLPGDARTTSAQPADSGSVGSDPDLERRPRTPLQVGDDWYTFTATFPLSEQSLQTVTFDPDGAAQVWTRVDDLATGRPEDRVYMVDWRTGKIQFGDGEHGAVPPPGTELEYSYETSPDVMRFGTSGTGNERFTSPRGVSARWNAFLRRFDVYVADTGNGRMQKFAFSPEDTTRHLPPVIRHVVSWSRAGTSGQALLQPTGVDVAADGLGRVYLAVTDPGRGQVQIFRDASADMPGSGNIPVLETTLGAFGNEPGLYVEPAGLTFLPNGNDLDLYVADAARRTVTKYEETPVPAIEILFVDNSALPDSFPPNSGYTIRFETRHAPLDGWVDFYFDAAAEFDPATAGLCFPVGAVGSTAASVFWRFSESPGGAPPDGSYYLHARLKDATGATVATDQSTILERLTIDSRLVAALQARDALDHDRTLYLQNNLVRQVLLELVYPDSTVGIGLGGSFDTSLVQIEAIAPGTVWNGVSHTDHIFSSAFDNEAGTFQVVSSVLGAPVGLVEGGPHSVAIVQVRCRPDAITPRSRVRNGSLALNPSQSSMVDRNGSPPRDWTVYSLRLRAGYLGDIATTSAGADSVVPALQPNPDGRIDYEDQMVFTMGWNGAGNRRDPIADLGPGAGTSPDILPIPDRLWDIDDLVVFTSQASYFYQAGWNRDGGEDPEEADREPEITSDRGGAEGRVGHFPRGLFAPGDPAAAPLSPGASVAPGAPVMPPTSCSPLEVVVHRDPSGSIDIRVECDPLPRLMGAFLRLEYDGEEFQPEDPRALDLLGDPGQIMVVTAHQPGATILSQTRLCPEDPGVDRGGSLGLFRFHAVPPGFPQDSPDLKWHLSYDLRDTSNRRLAWGTIPGSGRHPKTAQDNLTRLFLAPASPNPVREESVVRFGLSESGSVAIRIFDASGRRVRTLWDGRLEAGPHRLGWNAKDEEGRRLPSGVYFLTLFTGEDRKMQKISILR